MPIEVKGIEAVRGALDRLRKASRAPQVLIDLPDTEEQKIEWIVDGRKGSAKTSPMAPRDILQLTSKLSAAMAAAFAKGLALTILGKSADLPWKMAGEVYLKALQDRITYSGADIHSKLAPLRPSTIKSKGGNTRMFYKSGDLLKAILAAKIRIVR
jgi:hypothetical protein